MNLSRNDILFLEDSELSMDKACFEYAVSEATDRFNCREVYIMSYFEEGELPPATETKTEGLLVRAWNAILDAFRAFKEKLFSKEIPQDSELVVTKDEAKALSMWQKMGEQVSKLIRKPKAFIKKIPAWTKVMAFCTAILGAASFGAQHKEKAMRKEEEAQKKAQGLSHNTNRSKNTGFIVINSTRTFNLFNSIRNISDSLDKDLDNITKDPNKQKELGKEGVSFVRRFVKNFKGIGLKVGVKFQKNKNGGVTVKTKTQRKRPRKK